MIICSDTFHISDIILTYNFTTEYDPVIEFGLFFAKFQEVSIFRNKTFAGVCELLTKDFYSFVQRLRFVYVLILR